MPTPVRDEDLSAWPKVFAYNEDDTVDTITCNAEDKNGNAVQYVKTFGYSGGLLATVSEWVKQ